MLKSTFFEKKKNSLAHIDFADPPMEINFKKVDFSLGGKPCIVLPKWTFSAFKLIVQQNMGQGVFFRDFSEI